MDATDFRLLATLRHQPLASYEELAKIIERSPSSVRRRMTALHDTGVLVRFIGRPLPGAIGLRGIGGMWAETLPADKLFEVSGTIFVGTNIDGSVMIGGYVADEQAWLDEMSARIGSDPRSRLPLGDYAGPILGRLELKVLRAMAQNPRGTATELAELSGLSAKTVRKHRKIIVEQKAIDVGPMLRLGESGAIATHLHIACTNKDRAQVLEALGDVAAETEPDGDLCVFMRCDSLAEQERRLATVRALGHTIELVHEDEWIYNDEVMLSLIDGAIARWDSARTRK